jgi:predicted dehydrogenase
MENPEQKSGVSRRDFLKTSAAVGAGVLLSQLTPVVHAAGTDTIKVGLIGCGGRGTDATRNFLDAAGNVKASVKVIATGDLWLDRAKGAANDLKKNPKYKDMVDVPQDNCFGGFDNYKKVIDSGVDAIVTAAPPGFRAYHVPAAIAAGKHVFTEKPVCVDPWGYREMVKAGEMADEKKLTVVAGTQRRHQNSYIECVKRIHDGLIGDVVGGAYYWMGGPVTHNRPRGKDMSDVEWQISNWYAWSWTCGDHIVEQHVHNIDIMFWVMKKLPEKVIGCGGRQARPEPGNIYDHHAVEFTFPGDIRVQSYCTHFDKAAGRVSEYCVGTKGKSNCGGGIEVFGGQGWGFSGDNPNPYVKEHEDFINSIKGTGPHFNECKQVADSTMGAVLGRMATYTGREIKWDWATKASKLKLGPEKLEFGPYEADPVAIPGKTPLI